MKHLIETENPSGLTRVDYDRIILDSSTDNVIVRSGFSNGHPYVDLGLPSGTLWATMNVGATSETDYGYFFQWGETEPHDANTPYDYLHYKYGNGNYDALTKFGTLSSEQKDRIIDYIKDEKTGDEAEMRTDEMIVSLNDGTKMWFND